MTKEKTIKNIIQKMQNILNNKQLKKLGHVLESEFHTYFCDNEENKTNNELLNMFISSKKLEGCSDSTINYYKSTIEMMLKSVNKEIAEIETNDLRNYLSNQQEKNNSSKVTIDNIRRILSSFFSWLEDEIYIVKSSVRRIKKVKSPITIKETYSDEELEIMRDYVENYRDIALIDILASTGMGGGVLVKLNIEDINFNERECIVTGKGNKVSMVYFDAKTKIHLKNYLMSRKDTNKALFVSLKFPHNRISITGIETRLRKIGKSLNINKVHPHKFRRTLATIAIVKGMPIDHV
ncbi:Tyrosine recombinase xerC [Mycoplasmopsis canis UF31]|nr:tyrosine-type recombinase/integrase [Mycoplasmopsis canis]EIE40091.1 Tyrosine recombinase xerC [Mycoplasmopsis canis UF31]